MIDTEEGLAKVVEEIRESSWVAIDTEADSLHSYPEKLCLLQVSCGAGDFLVDTLARLDFGSLWTGLQRRELILHGADYDLRLLQSTSGFVPDSVFDTMLAARLLGSSSFGLGSLTEQVIGIRLEKGPQRADWSRRPLSPKLITYATNDVHYLKPLSDHLRTGLSKLARLDWHAQMCARMVEVCSQPVLEDPDMVWRIKGSNRLDRRGLVVLRELWQWREREARAAKIPPFFILSHDRVLAIAAAGARGEAIDSIVPNRLTRRRYEGICRAIERAQALPPSTWPSRLTHRAPRLGPGERHRVEELRLRRDRVAQGLGLDPTLIASRSTLVSLAVDWEQRAVVLLPWQRALLEAI